jgi:outer membrane lipoprotein-sorting protein
MCDRRHIRLAVAGLIATLAACGGGRRRLPSGTPAAPVPARASESEAGKPTNGLEVIGWMRYAHPSRALRSLAFTLNTTQYRADSNVVAQSRVYAELPGKMRVEALPTSKRTGSVRDRQRLAVFERGRRVTRLSRVDLSTLLVYDVFAQSADTTIMWLDSARVRFGIARRDELDGRDVWVVGAESGDTLSAQFWVDARRWLVLRIIQRDPRAPSTLCDIRFLEYTELLDVPVPTRIRVYREGRLLEEQDVGDLAANPTLPPRTFDLSRWRRVVLGT